MPLEDVTPRSIPVIYGTGAEVSASNPMPVGIITGGSGGSATIATGQVSVAATATLIVAARSGRAKVLIVNHGSTDIYVGASGAATNTGALLLGVPGAVFEIETAAAVYGIASSGSQTVSYVEEY